MFISSDFKAILPFFELTSNTNHFTVAGKMVFPLRSTFAKIDLFAGTGKVMLRIIARLYFPQVIVSYSPKPL